MLDHFLKYDENGVKMARKRAITIEDTLDDKELMGEYTRRILDCLNRPFTQGYYAQMAAAWLIAETFVTFPYHTRCFLLNNKLDEFTYKKALQKICESKTPNADVKLMIKQLKSRI